MSKKYKAKPCVYCVTGISAAPDHVFAREFFLKHQRNNLPKVRACEACNNKKSALETYLTIILPFGGRHADAIDNLTTQVPRRLAHRANATTSIQLRDGQRQISEPGQTPIVTSFPIEGEKIGQLFQFIVRGLMWHHWQVLLRPDTEVWAGCLTERGLNAHRSLLAQHERRCVSRSLGDGTFIYVGQRRTDDLDISVSLFSIYGGIKFASDQQNTNKISLFIGGVTRRVPPHPASQ